MPTPSAETMKALNAAMIRAGAIVDGYIISAGLAAALTVYFSLLFVALLSHDDLVTWAFFMAILFMGFTTHSMWSAIRYTELIMRQTGMMPPGLASRLFWHRFVDQWVNSWVEFEQQNFLRDHYISIDRGPGYDKVVWRRSNPISGRMLD